MAVTSVKEDFQARGGNTSISGGGTASSKATTTYTRRFVVQTSDVNDGPQIVKSATGVPKPYSSYSSGNDIDHTAQVLSIDAKPRNNAPTVWDVVVQYSTDAPQPPDSGGGKDPVNKPTDRPTKYSLNTQTVTRAITTDPITGRAIVNSAGDAFHPTPEAEYYLTQITVQRVEDILMFQTAMTTVGRINAAPFTIHGTPVPKHQARLMSLAQSPFFENGLEYWDTSYVVLIDPNGWDVNLLDQGLRKQVRNAADGSYKVYVITDPLGVAVNAPVNLDGAGGVLAAGAAPKFVGPFNFQNETNFDSFRL